MKNVIFLLICFQIFVNNVFSASPHKLDTILSEVSRKMDAVPLPDGYSIYGTPIIDTVSFDTQHINNDGASAHKLAMELLDLLKNPVKSSSFLLGVQYHSVEEYMRLYMSLIQTLYTLSPDTVVFFDGLFRYGEVCGIKIPKFDPSTPISKARAQLFQTLANWRVHGAASTAQALEAIRIERLIAVEIEDRDLIQQKQEEALEAIRLEYEKLKAIAAEEAAAKRKVAASEGRFSDHHLQEATSILRRRTPHGSKAGTGTRDTDQLLTPHSPLIKAH